MFKQFVLSKKVKWLPKFSYSFLFLIITEIFTVSSLQAHEESTVTNSRTHTVYTNLATAIAEANPADTLELEGEFTGIFTITQSLTLTGRHHATLDGKQMGSVLSIVGAETTVNLKHLTIKNGFTNDFGGGILNEGSALYLYDVKLYQNAAIGGGAIANLEGYINANHCKIHNNSAEEFGGGIASISGQNVVSDSKVAFNTAGVGGGVCIVLSSTDFYNVELEGNFGGAAGGAIFSSDSSTLNIVGSDLQKNSSLGSGGGLYNSEDSVANISHSKVKENFVNTSNGGGGIFSQGASLNLEKTEVKKNIPNNITES